MRETVRSDPLKFIPELCSYGLFGNLGGEDIEKKWKDEVKKNGGFWEGRAFGGLLFFITQNLRVIRENSKIVWEVVFEGF